MILGKSLADPSFLLNSEATDATPRHGIATVGGIRVDRFEVSAIAGRQPLTGLSPTEAADWCRQRHARLCRETEWEQVCRQHIRDLVVTYAETQVATPVLLRTVCNVSTRSPSPVDAPATCKDRAGIANVVGNVWEWVTTDKPFGYALKGGSYRTNDDISLSCAHRVPVHPRQASRIDLADIGFRCCYGP